MGDPLGSYVPPSGSSVLGSAHRVDPAWAAPRYAFAALVGVLVLGLGLAVLDGTHPGQIFGPPTSWAGEFADALAEVRRRRAQPFVVFSLIPIVMGLGATKRSFGLDMVPFVAGALLGIGGVVPVGVALRYLTFAPALLLGFGSVASGAVLGVALWLAREAGTRRQLAGYAIWAAHSLCLLSLAWWRLSYESPPTSFGEGALPYLAFSAAAGVTFAAGLSLSLRTTEA